MTERIDVASLRRAPALSDPRRLVDALALVDGYKPGKQAGGGLLIRCPVHGDRTPSCSVRRGRDGTVAVRCFACDFTGDALTLIGVVRGLDVRVDFARVVEEAASIAGVYLGADLSPGSARSGCGRAISPRKTPEPTSPPMAPAVSDDVYDAIATTILDACSPIRAVAPDVAAYLVDRGVFAEAEAVGVRGLPRDTKALVMALLAAFERADLEAAGVVRKGDDASAWPAHRVILPWRDRDGRIVSLQRRRINEGEPKYVFPSGRPPRAPFGSELLADALALRPDAEVVFVEGAIDTLARRRIAFDRGQPAIVLGVASASTACVGLPLDVFAGRVVVLALDADDAGEAACAELGAALAGVARELVRERPLDAKDWGDALVKGRAA